MKTTIRSNCAESPFTNQNLETLMKKLNSICPPPFGLGRLAIPMAFALLALGACKKKAEPPPVVRPVRSVVVEKRQLGDPAVGTGHLRARDEVNLAFRIGGRIIQRKVGVGDMVEAGQTVALLDAEVERNARDSAQADLAAARAALDQSEAFERRQKQLLTDRVISPNEYDTALRQLKTTKAQLDATEARLKSAEEQLSYTELKSNAAGVITEKGAEVGEVVPAGKMVLKVAQQSGRDAVFDVPAQAIRDGLSLGEQGGGLARGQPGDQGRREGPRNIAAGRSGHTQLPGQSRTRRSAVGNVSGGDSRRAREIEGRFADRDSFFGADDDRGKAGDLGSRYQGSVRSSPGDRYCALYTGLCHRDGRAELRRKSGNRRGADAP